MKDFHCRDAGMKCDFVARGNTDREILDQAGKHAQDAHGMKMDSKLEQRVQGLIHDENSDAHRSSMASTGP